MRKIFQLLIRPIDNFLNAITMYRLVLYYLVGLILVALVLGVLGVLAVSPLHLLFSTVLILVLCLAVNEIFSRVWKAPKNVESAYITALILALIISPPASFTDTTFLMFVFWAAVWSMASKYILAIRKKHIFNPAAFAVALTALTISQVATWWVGTLFMVPFVFIGGVLLVRKLRRGDAVISFIIVATIGTLLSHNLTPTNMLVTASGLFIYSPLFFFVFVMFTEPLTMPPSRLLRILYGVVVGVLFMPALHFGSFYLTPELALLGGNIFSYFVSPKQKVVLKLKQKIQVTKDVYDFIFEPSEQLRFTPGQYLEWTLPHEKPDSRGNRRYFTIASTPDDTVVYLGIKTYPNGSSFKNALLALKEGDILSAGSLAGDFILPKDPKQKLVFMAGGIGITPYLSMIQHLINKNDQRDIVLFYANKTESDIAYLDFLEDAKKKIPLTVVHALSDEQNPKYVGKITAPLVVEKVPDLADRVFYLSGPHGMVNAFNDMLRNQGIPKNHIKKDFFPGFA